MNIHAYIKCSVNIHAYINIRCSINIRAYIRCCSSILSHIILYYIILFRIILYYIILYHTTIHKFIYHIIPYQERERKSRSRLHGNLSTQLDPQSSMQQPSSRSPHIRAFFATSTQFLPTSFWMSPVHLGYGCTTLRFGVR